MSDCLVLAEQEGSQAPAGLDAEPLRRSDGAWVGALDGLDGAALWRSGGPGPFAFDGAAQWRNGVVDPDASVELDGEVLLRNGEAASAAFDELGSVTLLKNDVPWVCEFGGEFLRRSSGPGLAASAGVSQ